MKMKYVIKNVDTGLFVKSITKKPFGYAVKSVSSLSQARIFARSTTAFKMMLKINECQQYIVFSICEIN